MIKIMLHGIKMLFLKFKFRKFRHFATMNRAERRRQSKVIMKKVAKTERNLFRKVYWTKTKTEVNRLAKVARILYHG